MLYKGSAAVLTLTIGTKLGRYEIRSKVGEGGMGEVYLARDTKLDRTVAVKVLPTDLASDQKRMRRFVQEAHSALARSLSLSNSCARNEAAYNRIMFETATELEPDPVIEAYKKDIDRTLIRENLRLTVEQRFENLERLQKFANEIRRAVKEQANRGD